MLPSNLKLVPKQLTTFWKVIYATADNADVYPRKLASQFKVISSTAAACPFHSCMWLLTRWELATPLVHTTISITMEVLQWVGLFGVRLGLS